MKNISSQPFVLGIDVGATNIKFGLVDSRGKIVATSNLATASFLSHKRTLIQGLLQGCLALLKKHHLEEKDILGVGMGLPGLVDGIRGIVRFLPNIPGWKDVPLKEIMERRLRIPTFLDNDVNLITLAEWKFGAGKGIRNMVCLTLGTGVGSGLILDNRLYRGEGFAAGELGHVPLNEKGPVCNCGGRACLERYVGNRYLQKEAARIFKNKNLSLEDIDRLASQGDQRAKRFWAEAARHIGCGLVGVVNLLNPRRIVIGGGISNAYRHLFPTIRETLKKRAMRTPAQMVEIVRAQLGPRAGVLGAYVLVNHAHCG